MRRRRETPEDERLTAIHEAAHVIASIKRGRRFLSVSIVPAGDGRGCVRYPRTPRHLVGAHVCITPAREKAIEDSVMSSLAGGAADRLAAKMSGRGVRRGSSWADEKAAVEMLSWLNSSPKQTAAHLRLCRIRAEELVLLNWIEILALAELLVAEKTMSYRRVREVMSTPLWWCDVGMSLRKEDDRDVERAAVELPA